MPSVSSDAYKLGNEILVNTTTLGTQEDPAITALDHGGFVVSWTDFSETGGDTSSVTVRAQVFADDGSRVGSEILVPTTTSGIQNVSAITALDGGRFLMAWQDGSRGPGDNSGDAVRAQFFNADGSKSGNEFVLPATTFSHQDEPALATLPDGRFVAAWSDFSGNTGESDIRAQVFDADGTRASAEMLVNTSTANHQLSPTVTALADGHFVIAWTDYSDNSGGSDIRAQAFMADGSKSGSEFLVNTTRSSSQFEPVVIGLTDGRFVVSWTDTGGSDGDGYSVRAQMFFVDGSKAGGEFTVNSTTQGMQMHPGLAALPGGQLVAAWGDSSGADSSGWAVRAQLFGEAANKWGEEHVVNTTTAGAQWNPVVTVLHNGDFAVAWEDNSATGGDTSGSAIRAQVFRIGAPPVISSDGGGASANIALDENTTAVTTVTATDADSTTITYSIAGGADAARFHIDPTSGALSFISAPNFEQPGDADPDNSYQVVVRATDDTTLHSDQALTVGVNDVNEAPHITSGNLALVPENTTAAMQIEASDPDAGTTLQYFISGGADAALFHIDQTGALAFVHAPDFELPADANQDNNYEVRVRVWDGSLVDDQAIAVRVVDVPEPAPAVAKWGDELLVNTTTEGAQFLPALAGSPNGRFTATWTDSSQAAGDTSLDAIRAQQFNADGTKLGEELLVNSVTLGDQKDSTVTVLADGRSLVAWTNYHNLDEPIRPLEVRGQIFNADGTAGSSEFALHTGFGPEWTPTVAALADGGFVAAWTELDNDAIRAQIFRSDGETSGTAFLVGPTTVGSQADPVVTLLADGDFVVGWTDSSASGDDQSPASARARIFHPDGTPASDAFVLNTTTPGGQSQPAITALADGRFVASWTDLSQTGGDTDQGAIRGQIFNADGSKSNAEFLVNTTTAQEQDSPTIAGLLDARFVVAWAETALNDDGTGRATVRGQVFNTDGSTFGAEFAMSAAADCNEIQPTLAALADGRFVLGWADAGDSLGDSSGYGVHAQIFDARTAAVHLVGTAGDDDYIGTRFNDTVRGGGGNDHLDGGAGDDTAIYTLSHDQYTLQALAGSKIVVSGPEGTDTLVNFEHLQFADITLDAGDPHAPQIISDGGAPAAVVSIPENTTAVTTVAATDADPDTVLHYAIVGGADASLFHIDGATGALSFITAPDFEVPADANHDNTYAVVVRASDGEFDSDQALSVKVTDVSESPGGEPAGNPPPGNAPDMVWLTGTPGADSFTALPGNERIDALGGVDTVVFNFKLTEAHVGYAGNQVIIDGPASHTVLTGFETFVFSDGTVNNNDADPLVDDLFYYSRNHDVWHAHVDADAHYHGYGWHEGRDPSAFFDTSIYLGLNADVKAAGVDPLIQFDQSGWQKGNLPSLTFDPRHYLDANPDVKAAGVDPLAHFLAVGAEEGRQPFAPTELIAQNGFDYVYYLQHNPDIAAAGIDPLQHFETYGWKEGRNPNALFDVKGYLANYADVKAAGLNPLDHYDQSGWHEGRSPSLDFDTAAYLGHNADVVAAGVDPLTHFLATGIHEGRAAFADGVWG